MTSGDPLVQTLLLKAGQLEQTAQGPFPLGFEYLQGWLIQQHVWQSALVFDHLHSKKVFSND